MTTFVDTSALYALLDESDHAHRSASSWMSGPGREPADLLVSHSYVVVETAALVDRRLGRAAVRVLFDAFVPALSVLYVDERLHRTAVTAYLASGRGGRSLVDWVSFEMMRGRAIGTAFTFDRDFADEGFAIVPGEAA